MYFDHELQEWLDKIIVIGSNSKQTFEELAEGKSLIQQASHEFLEFDLEPSVLKKIIQTSNLLHERNMESLFHLLRNVGLDSKNLNVLHNVRWIFKKQIQPMLTSSSPFSYILSELKKCTDQIEDCIVSQMRYLVQEM